MSATCRSSKRKYAKLKAPRCVTNIGPWIAWSSIDRTGAIGRCTFFQSDPIISDLRFMLSSLFLSARFRVNISSCANIGLTYVLMLCMISSLKSLRSNWHVWSHIESRWIEDQSQFKKKTRIYNESPILFMFNLSRDSRWTKNFFIFLYANGNSACPILLLTCIVSVLHLNPFDEAWSFPGIF